MKSLPIVRPVLIAAVLLAAAQPTPACPAPLGTAAPVLPVVLLGDGDAAVSVERRVDAHLDFLASDEMGGRETGTLEGLITARYIESVFRGAGLQPAGDDGGYLQSYALVSSQLDLENTALSLRGPHGKSGELVLFDDYFVRGATGDGFDLSAGVVLVGHGIVAAEKGIDDYAGVDATGHLALMFDSYPAEREDLSEWSNWRAKREAAQAAGAVGMVVIADMESARTRSTLGWLRRSAERRSLGLPATDGGNGFPYVTLLPDAVAALQGLAGIDVAAEKARRDGEAGLGGEVLPGVVLDLKAPVASEALAAYNVAGMIRGSDPDLAHEYVVFSAHMDHIGRGADGAINNGADDNASGTTTLLTTAEVMARMPAPRRSILFLSVSGEEKGLLGSEWWVDHPTVPLEDVIADINIDMVGRNASTRIGATPSPEHSEYNTLVTRAREIGPTAGMDVVWEVGPEGGKLEKVDSYYHRSDHANFSKVGIPVVFFFSGVHEDYHQPGDTADKIDRPKLGRMVDLVGRLATAVANDPQRPQRITE